jgi:hypothetical protein
MANNNKFPHWANGVQPYSSDQNQKWQDYNSQEDQNQEWQDYNTQEGQYTSENNIAYPVQPTWGNTPQLSGIIHQQNRQAPRALPEGHLPSPRGEFDGWDKENENQWYVLLAQTVNGTKDYKWVLKR